MDRRACKKGMAEQMDDASSCVQKTFAVDQHYTYCIGITSPRLTNYLNACKLKNTLT